MPDAARQDMLNRAHEWDIMMTTGKLFPDLDPQAVRKIAAPALLRGKILPLSRSD